MNVNLNFLLILFGVKKEELEYDWMGFKLTDSNYLTAHHLKKCEDGGTEDINNLAILSLYANQYLNGKIIYYDMDIYNKINEELAKINNTRKYPTKEDLVVIKKLLEDFEKRYEKSLKEELRITTFNEKVLKKLPKEINVYSPEGYRAVLEMGIDPVKRYKKYVNKKRNVVGCY